MAKLSKTINKIGDALSDGIRRGFQKATPTMEKATKKGVKIGEKVVGKAVDVGLGGVAKGAQGAAWVVDHSDQIKAGAKKVGKAAYNTTNKVGVGVVNEAGRFVRAGGAALEGADKFALKHHIWREAGLDESMIKTMFTKRMKFGYLPLAAAGMSIVSGTKDQIVNRQGSNDGQIRRVTPSMTNPYDLSSQVAHSQMGRSYADNAGATGDLVFALQGYRK